MIGNPRTYTRRSGITGARIEISPPRPPTRRFSIRAGRTATIKVKVSKKVRKRAKRSDRGLVLSLRVSGTDTSGARISARKTIRLLPPKGR